MMKTSPAGLALIKGFEALRLKPYKDQAGLWTVGYGHLMDQDNGNFKAEITAAEAEQLFAADVSLKAERPVNAFVTVDLDQNEYDALVSLVFNIGPGAFHGSSTLRLLNAGDRAGAAQAMLLWNKVKGKSGKLVVSAGLASRRENERALFMRPAPPKPLPQSRTINGSAIAVGATAAGGVAEVANQASGPVASTVSAVTSQVQAVHDQFTILGMDIMVIKLLLAGLAIVGSGLAIYAYVRTHQKAKKAAQEG